VVNPTNNEIELRVDLAGGALAGGGTRWSISGPDEFAHNTPGQPRVVDIRRTNDVAVSSPLRVPALSATLFALPLR